VLRLDQPRRHDVREYVGRQPRCYRDIQPLDVRQPTADDDNVRIDDVDHAGKSAGQPVFVAFEAQRRRKVAAVRQADNGAGRGRTPRGQLEITSQARA
jgi:hypothetical protein